MRSRRIALRAVLGAAAWVALSAHSPYGQWGTFRKSRLIVFADAEDPRSQELAGALAGRIAGAVPASGATWARAPGALQLVKLLASHQADVILLPSDLAVRARAGEAPFAEVGALPIVALAASAGFLLLSLDEYPEVWAWQLARALAAEELPDGPISLHPGVSAYRSGKPMPASERLDGRQGQ